MRNRLITKDAKFIKPKPEILILFIFQKFCQFCLKIGHPIRQD